MTRASALAALALAACGAAPVDLPSLAEAERVCAAISACGPAFVVAPTTVSAACEIALLERASRSASDAASVACVLAAGGDCTAIESCFGFTYARAASCTSSLYCDGEALTRCEEVSVTGIATHTETTACAVGTCMIAADQVTCGTGRCAPGEVAHCIDDHTLATCTGGVAGAISCEEGLRCDADLARCVAAGEPCTADACAGQVRLRCRDARRLPAVDCGALGMRCADGACVPSASACVPGTFTATCDASQITYCAADGTVRTLDCRALGLGDCARAIDGPHCLPG